MKTDYSELKDNKHYKDLNIVTQVPKQSIINIKTSFNKIQAKAYTNSYD